MNSKRTEGPEARRDRFRGRVVMATSEDPFADSVRRIPETLIRRAWFRVRVLAARQNLPRYKSVRGINKRWLRFPLGGGGSCHYYLWWQRLAPDDGREAVFVHGIRHHDETGIRVPKLSPRNQLVQLNPRLSDGELFLTEQQDKIVLKAVGQAASGPHRRPGPIQIRGVPGAGKTITLLEIARRLETERVLFITLNRRLRDQAHVELEALDPGRRSPECLTLHEFYCRWLQEVGEPSRPPDLSVAGAVAAFEASLAKVDLRKWKNQPRQLYANIYRDVVGAAQGRRPADQLVRNLGDQVMRLLRKPRAETTDEVANVRQAFFGPWAARRLLSCHAELERALGRGDKTWTHILVDELQDLSEVELELLAKVAGILGARLVVAGDERQTIWPTGFDWDRASAIIAPQGKEERELVTVLRCGSEILRVIDAVSNLKQLIPKEGRPESAAAAAGEDPPPGVLHTVVVDSELEVADVLARAGAAVRQLQIVGLRDEAERQPLRDVPVASCHEVKGLEYHVVCVLGMGEVLRSFHDLASRGEHAEVRALLDEMTVAVSRATDELVFLERKGSPGMDELEKLLGTELWKPKSSTAFLADIDEDLPLTDRADAWLQEVVRHMENPDSRSLALDMATSYRKRVESDQAADSTLVARCQRAVFAAGLVAAIEAEQRANKDDQRLALDTASAAAKHVDAGSELEQIELALADFLSNRDNLDPRRVQAVRDLASFTRPVLTRRDSEGPMSILREALCDQVQGWLDAVVERERADKLFAAFGASRGESVPRRNRTHRPQEQTVHELDSRDFWGAVGNVLDLRDPDRAAHLLEDFFERLVRECSPREERGKGLLIRWLDGFRPHLPSPPSREHVHALVGRLFERCHDFIPAAERYAKAGLREDQVRSLRRGLARDRILALGGVAGQAAQRVVRHLEDLNGTLDEIPPDRLLQEEVSELTRKIERLRAT